MTDETEYLELSDWLEMVNTSVTMTYKEKSDYGKLLEPITSTRSQYILVPMDKDNKKKFRVNEHNRHERLEQIYGGSLPKSGNDGDYYFNIDLKNADWLPNDLYKNDKLVEKYNEDLVINGKPNNNTQIVSSGKWKYLLNPEGEKEATPTWYPENEYIRHIIGENNKATQWRPKDGYLKLNEKLGENFTKYKEDHKNKFQKFIGNVTRSVKNTISNIGKPSGKKKVIQILNELMGLEGNNVLRFEGDEIPYDFKKIEAETETKEDLEIQKEFAGLITDKKKEILDEEKKAKETADQAKEDAKNKNLRIDTDYKFNFKSTPTITEKEKTIIMNIITQLNEILNLEQIQSIFESNLVEGNIIINEIDIDDSNSRQINTDIVTINDNKATQDITTEVITL